jgi:hypothetical protein
MWSDATTATILGSTLFAYIVGSFRGNVVGRRTKQAEMEARQR